MKKFRSMKRMLGIALVLLLLFSLQVCASDSNSLNSENSNDVIASYETDYSHTSSDLFLYNNTIEVSDIVDGNVFAYGSSVTITGEIYGDLFVFANSLTIAEDAIIYGNVFSYATDIKISGIVSDVYAITSNFSLEASSGIARNLYLSSNTISLSGKVGRDAYISTENLSIGDTLGDNTEAIIQGNLNYISQTNFIISEDLVGGEINYTAIQTNTNNIVWSILSSLIRALLFALVIILLSVWLTPKFKERACEIITKKSFVAFGIGILVFLAIIIIAFILFVFTYGFGMSIAIALVALLILAYTISNTVFSMSISKLIVNKINKDNTITFVLVSLLIILIIELVKYIPYVGGPISFITSMIGLGILCINAYKRKDLVETKTEK